MGTLYVVATPIGNLEDLTPRARRILSEADLIACEDTRHTGMLLKRLDIARPLISVHAFNEVSRVNAVLDALESGDVALVSDAGTPGISDPGAAIVRAAAGAGHLVVPVPGPSALAAAFSASGFPPGPALFLGFLSRKASERDAALRTGMMSGAAIYLFESPHRVIRLIERVATIDPQREVIIFRELTKMHEEILRSSAREMAGVLEDRGSLRGECVVGIGPIGERPATESSDIEQQITSELIGGDSLSTIAKRVSAATGVPRSTVYEIARNLKKEKEVQ